MTRSYIFKTVNKQEARAILASIEQHRIRQRLKELRAQEIPIKNHMITQDEELPPFPASYYKTQLESPHYITLKSKNNVLKLFYTTRDPKRIALFKEFESLYNTAGST